MSPAVLVHLIKSRILSGTPLTKAVEYISTKRFNYLGISGFHYGLELAHDIIVIPNIQVGINYRKRLSLSASWKLQAIMKWFSSFMTFCKQYLQSRSPIDTVGRECLPASNCNLCELTRNRIIARWCFLFWIHRRWGSRQKSVSKMR